LDPHYTGGDEDLKSIVKKGWIAWQPLSVFRKDSFYNLCCPLVAPLRKLLCGDVGRVVLEVSQ
jgi:hypothetical protein